MFHFSSSGDVTSVTASCQGGAGGSQWNDDVSNNAESSAAFSRGLLVYTSKKLVLLKSKVRWHRAGKLRWHELESWFYMAKKRFSVFRFSYCTKLVGVISGFQLESVRLCWTVLVGSWSFRTHHRQETKQRTAFADFHCRLIFFSVLLK
jgi:hypothetical protein